MMNIDSELVLITVHKGPIKDLIKTLKSIDNQILKPKLNVVVVRNISFYEIKLFRNKKRIFIINKDKSIYNAMNIALSYKNISNYPLLFLNSGDTLFDKKTIYNMNKYLKLSCPIIGKQVLKIKKYFFEVKNHYFRKNTYLPHGAFVVPRSKTKNFLSRDLFFREKNLIDADGLWMRKIIKNNNQRIYKLNENISIHSLEGISTNPTLSTLHYYFSIGFFAFLKELVKFFLKKITVFSTIYYRIIFFIRYSVVKKND
jgi:hypothetical protein